MRTKLIIYNLTNPALDNDKVTNYCNKFSSYARAFTNTWIVKSDKKPADIRDELKAVIDGRGVLLVIDITEDSWGTYAVSKEVTNWMKENV